MWSAKNHRVSYLHLLRISIAFSQRRISASTTVSLFWHLFYGPTLLNFKLDQEAIRKVSTGCSFFVMIFYKKIQFMFTSLFIECWEQFVKVAFSSAMLMPSSSSLMVLFDMLVIASYRSGTIFQIWHRMERSTMPTCEKHNVILSKVCCNDFPLRRKRIFIELWWIGYYCPASEEHAS